MAVVTHRYCLPDLLLIAVGLCSVIQAAQPTKTPIIVELFTSEGCSSCPPADHLLARLEKEQPIPQADILAIEEHVDYWDQQGWRDPFSSRFFTTRQQEYAGGSDDVYTPQMVVDGRTAFVGSEERRAMEQIRSASESAHASLAILRKSASEFALDARNFPPGTKNVEVFLAITEDALASNVLRGENAGRRLAHAAVARSLNVIARFDARKVPEYTSDLPLRFSPEWTRENLRVIAFAQDRSSHRILGAASIRP
jgi:hypothetical protein